MLKIIGAGNKLYNLSEEIYVLTGICASDESMNYRNGTRVRLISGVNDSPVPGYHFEPDYLTVCRVGTERAEFAGFHRSQVILEKSE